MFRKFFFVAAAIGIAVLLPTLAQNGNGQDSRIERELEAGHYTTADSLLQQAMSDFIAKKNFDTLLYLIPLAGKISYQQGGADKAAARVYSFIETIRSQKNEPALMRDAYRQAAEFFTSISQTQKSFDASAQALKYSYLSPGKDSLELAKSLYNLGVYAYRLGKIPQSQDWHRRSLRIREASTAATPTDLYLSYNAMGSIFWNTSKYDSTALMFDKALQALAKLPDTDLNKYYRTANVQNNLAALYGEEGRTTEAITAMQNTIRNFQAFLAGNPSEKKEDATAGLFQAIDNLAGIYKDLGDYGKAGNLLNYSYEQKKQKLSADEPDIFISEILLGQYYNAINDYDKALQFLRSGLQKLDQAEGDFLFWQADGSYALAQVYENKKDPANAASYYQKSEALYETSYGGEYDNVYMDFLRNAALFYARNQQYDKAISIAKKPYRYLQSIGSEKSLQGFYQLLNIAEVNYVGGNFKETVQCSNQALALLHEQVKESANLLDSAKAEMYKPRAILIQAKAEYELTPQKTESYLNGLYTRLKEALQTLEKRKVLIDDPQSINILIADNAELIEFAKKIELELYQKTDKDSYLDNFINLHESGLYNRIRENINKEKAIRFANLPKAVSDEEQKLKAAIPDALKADKPNAVLMNDYIRCLKNWEHFLERIRKEYPSYYAMRYGSLFKALPELQSAIPENTTLVRYFFVDTSLFALVADSSRRQLVKLNAEGIDTKISSLVLNKGDEKEQLDLLNELYAKLWKPFESEVHSKKLMIIPDGILFNLSFDMLPVRPIHSFQEMGSHSLLSKYAIAYHYSLFMLDKKRSAPEREKNYIAFVPGFSDDLKKEYSSKMRDSVNLDYQYLSLLPQPNTLQLARKVKGLLEGDAYLDEASTEKSFIQNAAGHKIIHIGTHAEFNNTHPERSRLIFAKSAALPDGVNSLYLSDIYNCNMGSDLTILTACESGRPGFKDGEGMISLAHAFNYAGSKSILTGLWKLDEQASNAITDLFIQNLLKKMPTDEALRQAKLQYLATAEGRMKAPAYWAGIVLMGEPSVIPFKKSNRHTAWFVAGGILVLLISGMVIWQRRRPR